MAQSEVEERERDSEHRDSSWWKNSILKKLAATMDPTDLVLFYL